MDAALLDFLNDCGEDGVEFIDVVLPENVVMLFGQDRQPEREA